MVNKARIYIDSCCFIDVVKHAVGLALTATQNNDAWFLKQILEEHRSGKLIVHTSILAVAECVAAEAGQANVPQDVQERFRSLLTSGQYVHLLNPTPQTAVLVQKLRWDRHLVLSGADALHLASAIERGCTEFITTDDRLKKDKIKNAIPTVAGLGLRIISASCTNELSAASRQTGFGLTSVEQSAVQRPN